AGDASLELRRRAVRAADHARDRAGGAQRSRQGQEDRRAARRARGGRIPRRCPTQEPAEAGGRLSVKIFLLARDILTAIGGFVDIGDIVFNVAAGATFGYQLLWVVVVGVV